MQRSHRHCSWLAVAVLVCLFGWQARLDAAPQAPPAQKPNYADLPAKTPNATGLIVISHGWNSSPAAWANDLKTKITAALGGNANQWDIVAYDWSNIMAGGKQFGAATGSAFTLAGNLKLAEKARVNAMTIGTRLGQQVNNAGYQKIHFYSHSAGSWLNDRAGDKYNALGGAATVQQTFMDTFMPLKDVNDDLGDKAAFAVQYVDTREYAANKPFTNADLQHAYNIDITALDPDQMRGFLNGAHGWPHEWYRQTVANPAPAIGHEWGYKRSIENGMMPAFGNTINGLKAEKDKRGALPPPQPPKPAKQAPVNPGNQLDFRGSPQSNTGTLVEPTTGTSFNLDADIADFEPEAWIEHDVVIIDPVDILHFDYEFEAVGQGWLTVYLDNELVFHADERYARNFLPGPDSEYLVLGEALVPGVHQLAFRFDPYSDDPNFGVASQMTISDVWFSYAAVPEPATAALLALVGLGLLRRARSDAVTRTR